MRALPDLAGREEFDALVIRTDYDDEQAWKTVTAALAEPAEMDDDPESPTPFVVDDPSWAGAGVDEVLAALAADDDYVSVVFLADSVTMRADHHALLAVTTITREELDSDEEYAAVVEFGREFRTVAMGVHEIHTNLTLANMDFEEFSADAHLDPEGVFRSWWKENA